MDTSSWGTNHSNTPVWIIGTNDPGHAVKRDLKICTPVWMEGTRLGRFLRKLPERMTAEGLLGRTGGR